MNKIQLKEHEKINYSDNNYKEILEKKFFSQKSSNRGFCLGLEKSSFCNLNASYYIGLDWIKEHDLYAVVYPKRNYDFLSLFAEALSINSVGEANYFSQYFGIYYDKPEIEVSSTMMELFSPLLMIQYVFLLKRLVKHGLKKDYIHISENLNSKIKGRILFSPHYTKNVIKKREDHIYCGYCVYSENIPENRLLKKALLVVKKTLHSMNSIKQQKCFSMIALEINNLTSSFSTVSDELVLSQVKNRSSNKLYKEYPDAVKLAKFILKHFDYSIQCHDAKQLCIPFWIDMSRLFEMHVYYVLNKAYPNKIQFQVKGSHETKVDFIKTDEKLIIDAKYKPKYNSGDTGIVEDIREIAGYARDEVILRKLFEKKEDISSVIPKCLIIAPVDTDMPNNTIKVHTFNSSKKELYSQAQDINNFLNFRKLLVNLPTIKKVEKKRSSFDESSNS